jgi:hypothetical protein
MDADDCDALVAEILSVKDCPASRRLVLDVWGAPDRAVMLRGVLTCVREYAAHERALSGTGRGGGEVRGPCERPAGVACWWLGSVAMKSKVKPTMGWCEAGKRLPAEARFWCVESQGWWFRISNGG